MNKFKIFKPKGRNKDRENNELKRQIDQLEEKILTKEGEIKPLKAESRDKDKENNKLRQQVNQFQNINIHPGIREIAVKATGDDPVFGKDFSTLNIDENLPERLRNWLIEHLLPVVDPLGNMGFEKLGLESSY